MVYNRTDGVGWDNLVIIGIILGSFATAFISKEFSIVKTNKKIVIRTIIGSMLMGVGAVWAKGCLIGNGLVATSLISCINLYPNTGSLFPYTMCSPFHF